MATMTNIIEKQTNKQCIVIYKKFSSYYLCNVLKQTTKIICISAIYIRVRH